MGVESHPVSKFHSGKCFAFLNSTEDICMYSRLVIKYTYVCLRNRLKPRIDLRRFKRFSPPLGGNTLNAETIFFSSWFLINSNYFYIPLISPSERENARRNSGIKGVNYDSYRSAFSTYSPGLLSSSRPRITRGFARRGLELTRVH